MVLFWPKLGEELGLFRLTIQRSNLDGGTQARSQDLEKGGAILKE